MHEKTHQPLLSTLSSVVETVVHLRDQGHKIVLVSSGAVGVGPRDPASGRASPLSPRPESTTASGTASPALPRPPHTVFTPALVPMRDLKSWTSHILYPSGSVIIDAGAHHVLSRRESGGRLLAAGVLGVIGAFASGQAVRIVVLRGQLGDYRRRVLMAMLPRLMLERGRHTRGH